MTRFDWEAFLTAYHIEFFDSGANVARGNVNVRCPWCGSGDSSAHLGISLNGKGWGCWRNQRHRGRRPERLIAALIGTSWAEAARIVEARGGRSLPPSEDFAGEVERLLGLAPVKAGPERPPPEWPREIKPLVDRGRGQLYYNYIMDRNGSYTATEVDELVTLYGLRYATEGAFAGRVIFPVEDKEGLVSWTGRHIGHHPVRYRSLSADPEKAKADNLPQARYAINQCIFNEAELLTLEERWPRLIIGEGPFDAMRLDYFGFKEGARGSCLFGLAIYDRQIDTLLEIADRFDDKVLLLDRDATIAALTTATKLEPLGFRTVTASSDKDPGDMSPRDIKQLARRGHLA